jgi:hypothetical protein
VLTTLQQRCTLAVRIVIAHESAEFRKMLRESIKAFINAEILEAASPAECSHTVTTSWPELLFAPSKFLPILPDEIEAPLWVSIGSVEKHDRYQMVATLSEPSNRLGHVVKAAIASLYAAKTASLCNLVDRHREVTRTWDVPADIFMIDTEAGPLKIRAAEIRYVVKAANYLRLITTLGAFETRRSLSAVEQRFVKCGFIRVRRSVLVNKVHVSQLSIKSERMAHLIMSDGTKLRIGSTYRHLVANMEFGFEPMAQFLGSVFETEQVTQ